MVRFPQLRPVVAVESNRRSAVCQLFQPRQQPLPARRSQYAEGDAAQIDVREVAKRLQQAIGSFCFEALAHSCLAPPVVKSPLAPRVHLDEIQTRLLAGSSQDVAMADALARPKIRHVRTERIVADRTDIFDEIAQSLAEPARIGGGV